jgi:hypothetical protein
MRDIGRKRGSALNELLVVLRIAFGGKACEEREEAGCFD